MELPKKKTAPIIDLSTRTIGIYGPPGIGKSTLASQFPEALFLECEPGLKELEVYKIPTYTWPDLLAARDLVRAGDHKFKTVVMDIADNAFECCEGAVCAALGISHPSDAESGKGWEKVKNIWKNFLLTLTTLPIGFVWVSHMTDREYRSKTGKYNKIVPSLPERAQKILVGLSDIVLYCDVEEIPSETEAGKVEYRRVMHTKPNTNFIAKDRGGRLPKVLPLDFEAFNKAFIGDTKVE